MTMRKTKNRTIRRTKQQKQNNKKNQTTKNRTLRRTKQQKIEQ